MQQARQTQIKQIDIQSYIDRFETDKAHKLVRGKKF